MNRTLLFLFVLSASCLGAQSYDAALGLRLGTEWGATAQIRLPLVQKNFVAETILQSSLQRDEGLFTILGKQHRPLLSRRLNLFYGAGLHTGWNNEIDPETNEKSAGPFGVTGVVGAEMTIGKVNLSYDFKPAVNISGGNSVLYTQTAVSVRYVIAKRHDIWDKAKERDQRRARKQRQRDKRKAQRQQDREARGKQWFEFWKKGN
ncbi:hypothetical protein [Lewinella sp. W8]|uniref:hypothetical protein n=1 Tax=Lewinella sp. W8 TaxID=2528208 RepID=UPI0010678F26|nr:hypothetical protein [Lewinella sp. W8]MTB53096.1 hypothetical protein [Lewinella sp. W8]